MSSAYTTEIAEFSLQQGTEETAFLEAYEAVGEALVEMDGFVDRELLCDEDGYWVDVVRWQSRADAIAAAEAVRDDGTFGGLFGMMDESTVTMHHYERVRGSRVD